MELFIENPDGGFEADQWDQWDEEESLLQLEAVGVLELAMAENGKLLGGWVATNPETGELLGCQLSKSLLGKIETIK